MACYLTFTPANGGSFFNHWSETPVEGALACFVPSKPIPKFTKRTLAVLERRRKLRTGDVDEL